jgi:hypothetical protein
VFFTKLPIVKLMHDTAYLCDNLLKEGSKLLDKRPGGLFSNWKNFLYLAFLSAFLTYVFSYALNKQFWKQRPQSTKQLAMSDQ